MRLVILDDYDLASEWAAKYIRNRIIQFKPSADRYFSLGLPTGECNNMFSQTSSETSSVSMNEHVLFFSGSTPYGCYQKLIEYYRNGDISFKYVKTFNMDEYVGESNRTLYLSLCFTLRPLMFRINSVGLSAAVKCKISALILLWTNLIQL